MFCKVCLNIAILFWITVSFIPQRELKRQDIVNTLCAAITERKLVKFYYDDKYSEYSDWRVVEPHLIGDHKSTGNKTLVGWFIPTQQQKTNGHTEKWGSYLVNRIQKLQILDKTFQGVRSSYNPSDKRMKTIYCHL